MNLYRDDLDNIDHDIAVREASLAEAKRQSTEEYRILQDLRVQVEVQRQVQ